MTPFVVDAWVVACWLLPDERHPIAAAALDRIAIDSAIVPPLLWFELRNLLIVNERRSRIDSIKTAQALRLIGALPIAVDTAVDEDALMRLARVHRLTVYDAAYLELAQRRRLSLATLDAALASAARAEAVDLIDAGAWNSACPRFGSKGPLPFERTCKRRDRGSVEFESIRPTYPKPGSPRKAA